MVHLDKGQTEVQTDACAYDVQAVGVVALIESLEEAVGLLLFETYATVLKDEACLVALFAEDDLDVSIVEGVFQGIGE